MMMMNLLLVMNVNILFYKIIVASDTDSVDSDFDDPEIDEVLEVDESEEKKLNKKVSLYIFIYNILA